MSRRSLSTAGEPSRLAVFLFSCFPVGWPSTVCESARPLCQLALNPPTLPAFPLPLGLRLALASPGPGHGPCHFLARPPTPPCRPAILASSGRDRCPSARFHFSSAALLPRTTVAVVVEQDDSRIYRLHLPRDLHDPPLTLPNRLVPAPSAELQRPSAAAIHARPLGPLLRVAAAVHEPR